MLAVIKTGGKQYLVKEGDKLKIEKLEGNEGDTLKLEEVLLAGEKIGQPLVKGAYVEAKVLKQGKADKILVIKYKPKTRYRKAVGHRQRFTEIKIEKIVA
jgi:large subunit ribosomal protein L21